jgi:hypothetical protein
VLVLPNPYVPLGDSDSPGYGDARDFNYFQGGIPDAALPKLRVLRDFLPEPGDDELGWELDLCRDSPGLATMWESQVLQFELQQADRFGPPFTACALHGCVWRQWKPVAWLDSAIRLKELARFCMLMIFFPDHLFD